MGQATSDSGFLSRPDGTRLFWRAKRPAQTPRALVVVVHGLAEHSGRYLHVIDHLVAAGYACIAADHRGHGDSSGKRVFVERFAQFSDDVQAVVGVGQAQVPGRKVVLLGHSMGGLVVIQHLIDYAGVAELAVLSSPGVGIAAPVAKWKDVLAKVMSKVWPSLAIPTGVKAEWVSRDPAVVKAYDEDPKVPKTATARWYVEFLAAQGRAFDKAGGIKLPTLMLTAGQDKLVATAAEERWFKALGSSDKTLIPYPALYHEVMNEPEKAVVLGDITRWLDART